MFVMWASGIMYIMSGFCYFKPTIGIKLLLNFSVTHMDKMHYHRFTLTARSDAKHVAAEHPFTENKTCSSCRYSP